MCKVLQSIIDKVDIATQFVIANTPKVIIASVINELSSASDDQYDSSDYNNGITLIIPYIVVGSLI